MSLASVRWRGGLWPVAVVLRQPGAIVTCAQQSPIRLPVNMRASRRGLAAYATCARSLADATSPRQRLLQRGQRGKTSPRIDLRATTWYTAPPFGPDQRGLPVARS